MSREDAEFFSDTIRPISRNSPAEVFLLTIEAKPDSGAADFGTVGGAFVNCWIDADSLQTAERRAIALIREQNWYAVKLDTWQMVTRETYMGREPPDEGPNPADLVEQAFIDGEVCVFYKYPVNAPDAND